MRAKKRKRVQKGKNRGELRKAVAPTAVVVVVTVVSPAARVVVVTVVAPNVVVVVVKSTLRIQSVN